MIRDELKTLYLANPVIFENVSQNDFFTYLYDSERKKYDVFLKSEFSECEKERVFDRVQKAINGTPFQYAMGFAYFYTDTFTVCEGVLIPRADTETLVEKAIELLPENAHFLDLCCGSGCVGLSVLKNRPDTTATLVDICDTALEVSRENARLLGVSARASFEKKDILKDEISEFSPFCAILMNPPYITGEEMTALPDNVMHEPRLALFGGEDGLAFYRRAKEWENTPLLIFEIGSGQAESVIEIFGGGEIVRDLQNRNRVFIKKK